MHTKDKKNDVSLFQNNLELMAITETLVFTDPYYEAEMNNHTEGLDPIIKILREDVEMKSKVQYMLLKFTSNTETMCHGDLHSGSIMCTENDTKVIDPEFAFYGPMGFDLGMNIANYLMAFLSQPAHRNNPNEMKSFQRWILKVIEETVNAFFEEFTNLWHNSRRGILFPKCLYEDQGQSTDYALNLVLKHIFNDAISVCGIEMHRRCLSLAHNADFEQIEDVILRAKLEARNLLLGRELILCSNNIKDISELTSLASKFNERNIL
jgi:5-methylthioribose kinase